MGSFITFIGIISEVRVCTSPWVRLPEISRKYTLHLQFNYIQSTNVISKTNARCNNLHVFDCRGCWMQCYPKTLQKNIVSFRWRPKKIKKTTKQKGNLENQKMYDGMALPRLMGLYQMPSALASLILLPFRAPSSHSVQEKCVSCCSMRLICDKKQQTYLFCCQFGKGKKFLWPETELTL